MWVLPTMDRPAFLKETLWHMIGTGVSTPGVVVVNGSSREMYADVELPPGWTIEFLPRNLGLCGALNWAFEKYPNEPWYGMIGDDMVPKTPGWDALMLAEMTPTSMVSCNDNWQAEGGRLTVYMVGGDLLRTLDFWMPPRLWHCYSDDFWEAIGNDFKIWKFLKDVIVETISPFKGDVAQDDTTKVAYMRMAKDRKVFEEWKRVDKHRAYEKLHTLIGNGETRAVDLSKCSVMVCTPCGGGDLSARYLQSFRLMEHAFRDFGVVSDLWTVSTESIIARARNIALKTFLQSQATHLLFIDSDMGWDPDAALQLLASGKDLVAVAGPRKQHPVSFCALLAGPPVEACPETGLLRAAYVGTGFMLISRACAQKMWDEYPELAYLDGDQNLEFRALFDTEVREKRYWSEDYTFCHRWREIGGDVWVDPRIRLEHVGNFVYAGKFQDAFAKPRLEQAAE